MNPAQSKTMGALKDIICTFVRLVRPLFFTLCALICLPASKKDFSLTMDANNNFSFYSLWDLRASRHLDEMTYNI